MYTLTYILSHQDAKTLLPLKLQIQGCYITDYDKFEHILPTLHYDKNHKSYQQNLLTI